MLIAMEVMSEGSSDSFRRQTRWLFRLTVCSAPARLYRKPS